MSCPNCTCIDCVRAMGAKEERAARAERSRRRSLAKLSKERQHQMASSVAWLLRQTGMRTSAVGAAMGLSTTSAANLIHKYEALVRSRMRISPWSTNPLTPLEQRLLSVGAISIGDPPPSVELPPDTWPVTRPEEEFRVIQTEAP